jgi:mannose-6-phosphate isomerase-like protein (cupin superfamily)
MIGYKANIEELTKKNTYFRQVLFTGPHTQLVLMSLKPGEEIGMEVHASVDQFFRFEQGQGKVTIAGVEFDVKDGDVAIVPAGNMHNVVNTGADDLKLYTLYSPPNHPDGTIHKTKAEAEVAEKAEHH